MSKAGTGCFSVLSDPDRPEKGWWYELKKSSCFFLLELLPFLAVALATVFKEDFLALFQVDTSAYRDNIIRYALLTSLAIGLIGFLLKPSIINKLDQVNSLKMKLKFLKSSIQRVLADCVKDIYNDITIQLGVTERISIYRYTSTGLILCGQYSQNPDVIRSSLILLDKERGFVASVWTSTNPVCRSSIPSRTDSVAACQDCLLRDFRINSKEKPQWDMEIHSFCGFRLQSEISRKFIGVLFVESTERNRIDNNLSTNILNHRRIRDIIAIVDSAFNPGTSEDYGFEKELLKCKLA